MIPPLEPFKSPITGEIISNREQLRAHNKQHGVTNSADYGPNQRWVQERRKGIERQQATEGRQHRRELLRKQIRS